MTMDGDRRTVSMVFDWSQAPLVARVLRTGAIAEADENDRRWLLDWADDLVPLTEPFGEEPPGAVELIALLIGQAGGKVKVSRSALESVRRFDLIRNDDPVGDGWVFELRLPEGRRESAPDSPAKTAIYAAGDTYDVRCTCGWEVLGVGDLGSAGHLSDLHRGDVHFDD
jgi:hypothetical protein